MLKIGDEVKWSGSWGSNPEEVVTVTNILLCNYPGDKEGQNVSEVGWFRVKEREVIVDLDNGHWAWGFQIKKLVVE